ncbi:Uncharacterized protein TCAP_02394, partial [Tolypocladium capitatum]
MGFGRKSWRERLAQEPEISLLGTAFNLPTPRTLVPDKRRRASQDSPRAPRAVEVTRSSGRRIQIQLKPTTLVEESDTEQSVISSGDDDVDDDDDHDDDDEGEDSEATMVCTSTQSSGPNSSGARTRESRQASPPTCRKRSEGHGTPNTARPSRRESRRLRKTSTTPSKPSTVSGGRHSATLPAPHFVSATAQSVPVPRSCSAFPELPLHAPYSVQTPQYFYQQPQLVQAPNQLPTSAPMYTPGYAAQHMFASEVRGASCPNPSHITPAPGPRVETRAPTGQFSRELQRIQHSIDQARAKLSQKPGDSGLQQDMQVLQNQLNSTLNNATAQPGFGIQTQSSPAASENKPQAPDHETKDCEEPPGAVPEQVAAANAPRDQVPVQYKYSAILEEQPMPRVCPIQLRDESPGRVIRHHLCSSCGEVRSAKFHGKHPIVPGQKPLLNYCSPCKEAKLEGGIITEPHHFCFGCGVVRSKAFQRRHAATMEEPLQPNYCGKCTREVRETESMVDSSIVNSEFESSRRKVQQHAPIWSPSLESDRDSAERRETPEGSPSNNTKGERISLQHRRRRRAKRSSKTVPLEQLRLASTSPSLSHASAVPTSSFCPDRRHGSAQRRAQRGAIVQGEDYTSPISATPDKKTVYNRPYVEDDEAATLADHFNATRTSSHEADGPEKRSGSSQASSCRKSTPKSCLRGTEEDSEPDACSPPIFQSPPNDRRQASAGFHYVDSSGNKTVKFTPTVKVRRSSTRQSSNTSSHAEISEAVISPAEQTTPTRPGVYGDSPPLSDGSTPALMFQNAGDDWPFEIDEASPTSDSHGHGQEQPLEINRTSPEPEIPTRFSRGAFGQRPGSGGDVWMSPSMDRAGAGCVNPRDSYHRSSPLAEGFPPDVSGMFDSFPSGGCYEDPPSFRSSRGAFGSMFRNTAGDFGADRRRETQPTDYRGEPGHSRDFQAESSTFRGYNSSSGTGSRTKHDDGSHGSYSEHTSSSDNPYYKPSRFANVQNLFNQSTQSWGSDLGRGGQSRNGKVPNDEQVPEPIIEEPDSPPDSPWSAAADAALYLPAEFNVQVVTDSSTESEGDALEIEDLSSNDSLDEETDHKVNT